MDIELYDSSEHLFSAFNATLREFFLVDLFSCCLVDSKKRCENSHVFWMNLWFCDIFYCGMYQKRAKKGVRMRKKRGFFSENAKRFCCNHKIANEIKIKWKIIKFFLQKVLCEIKKSYLCTRKTTGNGAGRKGRGFAKVLWKNDPSKVWKVRVREYEKTNHNNSKTASESRQKKIIRK